MNTHFEKQLKSVRCVTLLGEEQEQEAFTHGFSLQRVAHSSSLRCLAQLSLSGPWAFYVAWIPFLYRPGLHNMQSVCLLGTKFPSSWRVSLFGL